MNRIGELAATSAHEAQTARMVWRITHNCPACRQAWSYDILDVLGGPTIPDDVRLGPWLLCGSCEARRRINYRQVSNGKTEWWAPFWGDEQTAMLFARVREKAGTFTTFRSIGEYTGQKLLDEKTSLIRILTRVPTGNGWYRNIISISSEEYFQMGCKWPIPKRPNAPTAGGWK